MLLTDIVSHKDFVLSKSVPDLRKQCENTIYVVTGISVNIGQNPSLNRIVKSLAVKFNSKKVNKEKFLKLEQTWLASKYLKVIICFVRTLSVSVYKIMKNHRVTQFQLKFP